MPVLKNAKHERFAQLIFQGVVADDAYVQAGFKFNRGNAGRLKANESVQRRVAELSKKAADNAEITVTDVIAGLKREAELTGEGSSHGARVSALAHLGKYLKMFTDRVEVDALVRFSSMSEEELNAEIARRMAVLKGSD